MNDGPRDDEVERGLDLERVVLFSDAVFAIAMTVLAVELALPANVTNPGVTHALREAIPSISAYFLSFAVIGLYWLAHHRTFRRIARIDSRMMVLNLVVLSLVAFLPFPTRVFGEHASARAAVIFYAGSVSVLGAAFSVSWGYASYRMRLLRPDTPRSFVRHTFWRGAAVPAVFALSIPVALISPRAAEWFWVSLFVVHEALARVYGRISST